MTAFITEYVLGAHIWHKSFSYYSLQKYEMRLLITGRDCA